jgi:dTDP-4-dehydrorhamnose reductase
MKILILGVTGMLGNAVFKVLSTQSTHQVWATLRNAKMLSYFDELEQSTLISDVDVLDSERLQEVLEQVQPDVVINCVGLIKQLDNANDPLVVLPINALFPHQLANLCAKVGARLIHISTDCIFNGRKGLYKEVDLSDAEDLYGKSKYIGELHDMPHAVTLRTSIIGHELNSTDSLVDWFLSQNGTVKGYEKAVFSGLPTVELAKVIKDFVIPRPDLHGLFHVSADPIDKYSLLNLIADSYHKKIDIIADDKLEIDRSLNSDKFRQATDYQPPSWPILIDRMYRADKGIE